MARTIANAYEDRKRLAAASAELQAELRRARVEGLARLRHLLATGPETRPRRVLLVSRHPYPDAPLLRRNANHLAAEGVEVDLVCARPIQPFTSEAVPPGLRLFSMPVRHREPAGSYVFEDVAFFLLAFPLVSILGLVRRYEAVQVDNPPDFLPFVAIFPRLRGSRVVFYMYDMFPELAMTRLGLSPRHPVIRLARLLERMAVRWVDHAVVVGGLLPSHPGRPRNGWRENLGRL